MIFDKFDDITDGFQILGVFVGDLDIISVFYCHDELNGVDGIDAEIAHEIGVQFDLVCIAAQDIGKTFFYLIKNHIFPLLRPLFL